jgi:hypothetical protein
MNTTAPLPEKLARRARILGIVTAPIFAAIGIGFVWLGLGFWPILAGGVTVIVLAGLLLVSAVSGAPVVRWIAVVVGILGAGAAASLAFTTLAHDLGLAMTYVLGILPIIVLAVFVVLSVSRARQRVPA